jgi:Arylsulfotransferase (ASST)
MRVMLRQPAARAIYQNGGYARASAPEGRRHSFLLHVPRWQRRRWHDSRVPPLPKLCRGGLRSALRAPAVRCSVLVLGAAVAASADGCGGAARPAPVPLSGETAARHRAATAVTVSPLAGTRDASPASQISFLGETETRISHVRVLGAQSGQHPGVLRAYSTGTGESFLPSRPFLPGERVSVSARASSGGSERVVRTTFTVAQPAPVSQEEFPREKGDARAVQHFLSAPGLSPSTVTVSKPAAPGASPGYVFLAPYQGQGTAGPMIADQSGQLVWFHPLSPGIEAANFGVQGYRGEQVLAWWQGHILQLGFGQGEVLIYDHSYRQIGRVRAGNGLYADLHILRLTSHGTAWIDAFDPIRADLSGLHGSSNGVLTDSVIQQIDVKTGLVMWEWHALGHVPVSDSYQPPPSGEYPWDYVHVNSLDLGGGGDVLIGARNTSTLYDVDLHTGAVRWRLGGKRSSFALDSGVRFYWQHDAEFQSGGLISLFDNASDPPKEAQSRAIVVRADAATHTATLVQQFVNPSRQLLSASQGNSQRLGRGNWLIGYGRLPNFSEFDAQGRLLLDASLGKDVQSFSAFIAHWQAAPSGAPTLVVSLRGAREAQLAASWNGATDVAYWRVLAGPGPRHLSPLMRAPRRGFETVIAAPLRGSCFAVQALDRAGRVLGTSAAVKA